MLKKTKLPAVRPPASAPPLDDRTAVLWEALKPYAEAEFEPPIRALQAGRRRDVSVQQRALATTFTVRGQALHAQATLQDVQTALQNCALKGHTHPPGDINGLPGALTQVQTALDGKAPASHTHAPGDVNGLVTTLQTAQDAIAGKAALAHTHAVADVNGLAAALNNAQQRLTALETAVAAIKVKVGL